MPLDLVRGREWLAGFDFIRLFTDGNGLGWDRLRVQPFSVDVDGQKLDCEPVAQKCGFAVWLCRPADGGAIPDYPTRRKVEQRIRKLYHEHFVIFVDGAQTEQKWLWVRREPGKPAVGREYGYTKGQSGDSLLQRLSELAVSLEEELQGLVITDVVGKVGKGFDRDKVTKKFYDRFKEEHAKFLKFLEGIPDDGLKRWYASVMLNRLMFIYFIQKKGFLGGDHDYLKNKLAESKQRARDRYYRDFLCPLFFEGFARKPSERSAKTRALLGDVPYLNGGIFLEHEVEKLHGRTIEIADKAFDALFAFFDEYRWHLDERPLRDDKEINPDVLGYIFEKYVNQKQMGAYYTKEDITEYIGRNTIVPRLLDIARQKCRAAFDGDNSVWRLLREDPDRYIFEPVRRGVIRPDGSVLPESALPDFVQAGMHDPKKRMFEKRYNLGEADLRDEQGNKLTLPTETWREYVARRQRCLELRDKLANGEVRDVNDLITFNLDIRRFAQDVVEDADSDLLRAIWRGLNEMTVLDPTCGSGAFLFAALNILQPLYEGCLNRMRALVDDLDRSGEKHSPKKYEDFRQALARVADHPSERYFILKSIVVNNLYGVDIMDEAVEICKLRLFLKLVAQVDKVDQIEPLPDIDFNIRCGNTLVGYATYEQVERAFHGEKRKDGSAVQGSIDFAGALERIQEKAQAVEQAMAMFRRQQTELGGEVTAEDKADLQKRLRALEDELNRHLAREYGKDPKKRDQYEPWLKSHKPFHWFIEFYGIMKSGGFDVIIGNPPYVDYDVGELGYACKGFVTAETGDLYAMTIERSFDIMRADGRQGMIVPLSLTFSRDFSVLRKLLLEKAGLLVYSSYDNIPDRLFTGAKESNNTSKANQQRTTIFVCGPSRSGRSFWSSPLLRWRASERWRLFQELPLCEITALCTEASFPKVGSSRMREFLERWLAVPKRLGGLTDKRGKRRLVVPKSAGYYIAAYPNELDRSQQLTLQFSDDASRAVAMTLLNSGAFYWLWRVFGDSFHVTGGWIDMCPVPHRDAGEPEHFAKCLVAALKECTVYKGYRGVDVPNVNFNKRLDLLWEIDEWIIKQVAPDLGVTPEDFLWAKSSSFLKLRIAKSGGFPPGYEFVGADD